MKRKAYSLMQIIIIIIMSSVISGLTVGVIINKNNEVYNIKKTSLSPKLKSLINVYNSLLNDYYLKVDEDNLINSAIDGMAMYLNDNYTVYFDKQSAKNFKKQLDGQYIGIGIKLDNNEIVDILPNSPCEKTEIKIGDKIVKINEENVLPEKVEYVLETISNYASKVNLSVLRNGEILSYTVDLDIIQLNNVSSYIIDNTKIGYIKISSFARNTSKLVEENLKNITNDEIDGIIIDLRGNTGGYLDEAYYASSLFLKDNSIIYSLNFRGDNKVYYDNNSSYINNPIIILTDSSTASAAEIMVAALKDNNLATIVGIKTYGKGKVQHTYKLEDGGILKYTSSKWIRPNGECVDNIGIQPDYDIKNESNNEEYKDSQLLKAIELLSK